MFYNLSPQAVFPSLNNEVLTIIAREIYPIMVEPHFIANNSTRNKHFLTREKLHKSYDDDDDNGRVCLVVVFLNICALSDDFRQVLRAVVINPLQLIHTELLYI